MVLMAGSGGLKRRGSGNSNQRVNSGTFNRRAKRGELFDPSPMVHGEARVQQGDRRKTGERRMVAFEVGHSGGDVLGGRLKLYDKLVGSNPRGEATRTFEGKKIKITQRDYGSPWAPPTKAITERRGSNPDHQRRKTDK
ncbi:MAG: hypothetical protein V1494_00505 [Candidatus Diapherotrites archaeon]